MISHIIAASTPILLITMATNIVHWNMQGFRSHYADLRTLLAHTNAVIMCLQETRMPTSIPLPPRGFQMYHKAGPPGRDSLDHGGVAILVKNSIGHTHHPLQTGLQAVAIRCHLDRQYTVCSLYLPPSQAVQLIDLLELIVQLTPPFFLLGDFNARHQAWGDTTTNQKGQIVEGLLQQEDCTILNDGRPTHFHSATNTYSCIDLSICSASLLHMFSWQVHDDLYQSDHFPVIISQEDTSAIATTPRYKFDCADWSIFGRAAACTMELQAFPTVDEALSYFTALIIEAADRAIPKTADVIRTRPVPWWNRALRDAHAAKKKATRRYRRTQLVTDKIALQRARAQFRYLQRTARTTSWQSYVSSINTDTPINKVWQRVKKIQGRYVGMHRPVLQGTAGLVTDPKEVANIFGEALSNISRGPQSPTFLRYKRNMEASPVNFPDDDGSDYNIFFTQAEMTAALRSSSNTAAGGDNIHYSMLRNLPEVSLSFLLALFNRIWSEGIFPQTWREAIVLPFLKKGKDAQHPSSYRPIALTSCVCKLLERMVNSRLMWYLEEQSFLHGSQYGFRRHRCTTDALVRLDNFIKIAFARKEHVVAVFFDVEKAYDTTWRHNILQTLHEAGLCGPLPRFLQNFLQDRVMRVRVGNTLSDQYHQYEGVPQGSVLSCSLFAVAINGLASCLPAYVESSLYVDDFAIFTKSSSLPAAERRIQLAVNKAQDWTQKHGFIFSTPKTVCVHFTRVRGVFPPLTLTLHNVAIKQTEVTKFLGLVLDSRLTYVPHLKDLRQRCLSSMQLMKCLSHFKWGADRSILVHIYRALIRSRLDYACQIYASATRTALKMIDPVHHQALRLATGAFRSTPVVSLYAETGEPSLTHRRDKLSLQLYVRLLSMPGTPAHTSATASDSDHLFQGNGRLHTTYGFRVRQLLLTLDADAPRVMRSLSHHRPPHTFDPPSVCSDLFGTVKTRLSSSDLRSTFERHALVHYGALAVYTDGSKCDDGVGCAAVFPCRDITSRLPAAASIYTAELRAILSALAYMVRLKGVMFVIHSDSRSALQAISDPFTKHPVVYEIHRWIRMLQDAGKSLTFCWVPSHVGIAGNERADTKAREAISGHYVAPILLPHRDYYPHFASLLWNRWLSEWRNVGANKLRSIKSGISVWSTACRSNRYQEVILARLRLGHTKLTHSHLMCGDQAPYCVSCIVPLTVVHMLTECPEYVEQRRRCYNVDGLQRRIPLSAVLRDEEVAVSQLFTFLSTTGLLSQL